MTEVFFNNFKPLEDGFTVFSRNDQDQLFVNPLFKMGKQGDEDAARNLVAQVWTDAKTEQLQRMIQSPEDVLFVSVPGTTRKNKIPIVFAEFLAEKTGASYLVGDEHVHALHSVMMKSVPHGQRVFYPRLYQTKESDFFETVREAKPNCRIFLVEDTLTTGASSYAFFRFLQKNGLDVRKIFAIKGDTASFSPSKAEILKLQKMADKVGLGMDLMPLGSELTRVELSNLSFQYLGVFYAKGSEEQKALIREQLRCLYAVRVDGNFDEERNLQAITEKLKTMKGEQENVSGNVSGKGESAQEKKSGVQDVSGRPSEDPTRSNDCVESKTPAVNECNADKAGVRDNGQSGPSAETEAPSQGSQQQNTDGKSTFLKKFFGKNY